ncbi:MAG: FMN-binding protein [Defluviitaleaceae bacterium]|nr:FMN-binding protein [Defluviitaleaceae bacterium]
MKNRKKIVIIVGALIILLAGGIALLYPSGMRNIELQGIDLTTLDNGSYTGTFERGRFTNTLTVHVENNRIVSIEIVDDVFGSGITNASDEVFSRVIAMQDTRIDTVSGATATTNAYLKAIENALLR